MMLSRFYLVFIILGIISTTGCDANRAPLAPQPNRPPAWGGLVGIQSVLQEGTSVVITYGIAIDPEGGEVTYDLYWVDETQTGSDDPFSPPGHIDSDIGSAPYVKTGLEYGHTYWFSVKARDESGLCDQNMGKVSVTMVN